MTGPDSAPRSSDSAEVPATPKAEPRPPWYARWGNASQMASALVAAVGFTVIVLQLQETREKNSAEAYRAELADARKIYATYSESVLRYPQLSVPDYDALMRSRGEYLRYQTFVAHMIYAYDDILNVVEHSDEKGAKKEWLVAFDMDVRPHRRYLCHPADPRFFEMYRPSMQELLRSTAGDCKDLSPLVPLPEAKFEPIND